MGKALHPENHDFDRFLEVCFFNLIFPNVGYDLQAKCMVL
jgi:hypothetical protein